MVSKVYTGTIIGLEAIPIMVEGMIAGGLPAMNIVGLPDKAVEESRERVRSALSSTQVKLPAQRITVNLSPADIPKSGSGFDLPIALSLISCLGSIPRQNKEYLAIGELSLDGTINHTAGILPVLHMAEKIGIKYAFVPREDAQEASIIKGIKIFPVGSLTELIAHLQGITLIKQVSRNIYKSKPENNSLESILDLSDIKGQLHAKRALLIAAAGGHNLVMTGPAGSGKTMLARAMPSILPPLNYDEALEVTTIASVAGILPRGASLIRIRPFRAPHHTTSRVGLIGGGSNPTPGEVSLAHRGVLFLDEFPEFPRSVLESLRQPIEDRQVTVTRAKHSLTFPSQVMLIAAQNPCPCGNYGNVKKPCSCSTYAIEKYQRRVSGPLWERFDLHVYVPAVEVATIKKTEGESSVNVRDIVTGARTKQEKRLLPYNLNCNAEMSTKLTLEQTQLEPEAENHLQEAAEKLAFSARTYIKTIKVARTIADLEDSDTIKIKHVTEAISFRMEH